MLDVNRKEKVIRDGEKVFVKKKNPKLIVIN